MTSNLGASRPLPTPPAGASRSPHEPQFADAVAGAFMLLHQQAGPWMPLALDYWCESNPEGVTVALAEHIRALRAWEEGEGRQTPDGPPLHLLWCIILLSGVGILQLRGLLSDEELIPDAQTLFIALEPVFVDCVELMLRKNHDYGDSWRYMRIPSITDQLLVKALRLQQLEELEAQGSSGQVAEGRESEYRDILNYGILEILRYTSLPVQPPWPVRQHSSPLIPHVRG